MTAVLLSSLPAPSPAPPPRPRTLADLLRSLGGVPPDRVLFDPSPGSATVDDVVRLSHHENRGVELVNGTLVEKPVGLRESVISGRILTRLNYVVEPADLGFVSGEQGMIRMLMGNVRMPDVAYFRREDLPDGRIPEDDPAPRLAPALAVEVLSPSNTDAEMRLKLREYFENGVRLAWLADPPTRTVRVYEGPETFRTLSPDDTLDGGDVLPGFAVRVGDLFPV